jgi:hypothetical protein
VSRVQLFQTIDIKAAYRPQLLPRCRTSASVDGYFFSFHGMPRLHPIQPSLLDFTVTGPDRRQPPSRPVRPLWRTRSSSARLARLRPHPRLCPRRNRLFERARRQTHHRNVVDTRTVEGRHAAARRRHVAGCSWNVN